MLQDEVNIYEAKIILGRHKNPNWQLWNHSSTSQELQGKQAQRLWSPHTANWIIKRTPPFQHGSGLLVITPCQYFVMWLQVLNHHTIPYPAKTKDQQGLQFLPSGCAVVLCWFGQQHRGNNWISSSCKNCVGKAFSYFHCQNFATCLIRHFHEGFTFIHSHK